MAAALAQSGMNVSRVNELLKTGGDANEVKGKNILEIANAIFIKPRLQIKPSFMQVAHTFYDAQITSTELNNPTGLHEINNWVDKKTHGRITDLVTKLNPQAVMVLINAVYFKGIWAEPFNKTDTKQQDFHLDGGGETQVQMMHRSGDMLYYKGTGFEALRLPYSENKESMVIMLPAKNQKLDAFLTKFATRDFQAIGNGLATTKVNLALPRFRIESFYSLVGPLKGLGMQLAFDPLKANFGNLSPAVYITDVMQKAFIDTNEEGSEAAAATAVVMSMRAVYNPHPPINFVVDRPFLFALQDSTGDVLFLGVVKRP